MELKWVEKTLDRYILLLKVRVNSKIEDRLFVDRRCAFTWPGPNSPGYFCIFGLLDDLTGKPEKTLYWLCEESEENRDIFFSKLISKAGLWACELILSDESKRTEPLSLSLYRKLNKLKPRYCNFDTAENWGSIEDAYPIIQQRFNDGLLMLPPGTELSEQLSDIKKDDLRTIDHITADERWYAIKALSHIVTSYEIYPWVKPKPQIDRRMAGGQLY